MPPVTNDAQREPPIPLRKAKEDEIFELLVAGFAPAEAAERSGRSPSTVYRLMSRLDFRTRLAEAKAARLRPHVEKLNTALGRAIDKMLALMDDPTVVHSTQLRAAIGLAELAIKLGEHVEVYPKLAALEYATNAARPVCPTCAAGEPDDE